MIQVYEGAVYMHQGHTYLVKELNLSSKIALCQKADLKYFTKTRDYTDIHVSGGNNVCELSLQVSPFYLLLVFIIYISKFHIFCSAVLCSFSDIW